MAEDDDRSTYTVERTAVLPVPADRAYPELADFRNWAHGSPWEGLDPELQRTHSGAASGVGAVYEWKGNRKAGEGRMEITEATAPTEVVIQLDFLKPFKSSNVTRFDLAPDGEGTRVTSRCAAV